MRVEAILIQTTRPEELAEFYRAGLELGAPKQFGEDHLGFILPNLYLGFERAARESERGPISVWFYTREIEATYRRLVELGARPKQAPTKEESPGETLATVFDPEGNVIGLIDYEPKSLMG
jgi:predicted enzyme related to lactoylglutathione lyase